MKTLTENYYFDTSKPNAACKIGVQLTELLLKTDRPLDDVIIICIGTDRSTGDSLGPLVGYKLSKFTFENVHVYGCLQSPIHAANLSAAIDKIRRQHSRPFIIALDASLGKKEHIGFITIGTGPLKQGLGVKKKLPEVGDIHITGIVNNSGATDHVLLQTTRLSMIMTLADTITAALVQTFLTNASPDTLQVPAQPLLHRQIS
jgi:putative sporulation protein YyaC